MDRKLDRSDPPYIQIANQIRGDIKSGALGEGEPVPSARQIAADWGVALATATRVLAALRADGLVRSVVGVGTVVDTSTSRNTARDRLLSVRRTGRVYPQGEHAVVQSAKLVTDPPDRIRDAVNLTDDGSVIRRHRITYRDDAPVSESVSWLPGDLADAAPLLLDTARIPQGTFAYVEEVTGRAIASGRDQIAAGPATREQAKALAIKTGSPVLTGRNWLFDAAGAVIEFGESVSVADRWSQYDYELA